METRSSSREFAIVFCQSSTWCLGFCASIPNMYVYSFELFVFQVISSFSRLRGLARVQDDVESAQAGSRLEDATSISTCDNGRN